jgi:hypothetical protein
MSIIAIATSFATYLSLTGYFEIYFLYITGICLFVAYTLTLSKKYKLGLAFAIFYYFVKGSIM